MHGECKNKVLLSLTGQTIVYGIPSTHRRGYGTVRSILYAIYKSIVIIVSNRKEVSEQR